MRRRHGRTNDVRCVPLYERKQALEIKEATQAKDVAIADLTQKLGSVAQLVESSASLNKQNTELKRQNAELRAEVMALSKQDLLADNDPYLAGFRSVRLRDPWTRVIAVYPNGDTTTWGRYNAVIVKFAEQQSPLIRIGFTSEANTKEQQVDGVSFWMNHDLVEPLKVLLRQRFGQPEIGKYGEHIWRNVRGLHLQVTAEGVYVIVGLRRSRSAERHRRNALGHREVGLRGFLHLPHRDARRGLEKRGAPAGKADHRELGDDEVNRPHGGERQ